MFTTMRSLRTGLSLRSVRCYATMAEYRLDFSNEKAAEIQETFGGAVPALTHFTTDAPQLVDHNKIVLDTIAKINKDEIKVKLVWADVATKESQMWLQSMGAKQAPLIIAIQKGQVLDTHAGICSEEFLNSFLTKFVSFTSDEASPEVAAELDDSTPAGRFAKLGLDSKNGTLSRPELIEKLGPLITEIEDIVKAEKKTTAQKKLTGPPTATPTQELLAKVNLLLCATTQITDNKSAEVHLEKIRKSFGIFNISEISKAIAVLEMNIACDFTHAPPSIYEAAVASAENDEEKLIATHRLAVSLFHAGDHQPAVNHLLGMLKRDKKSPARVSLVSAFHVLGPQDDITIVGRKTMLNYMF